MGKESCEPGRIGGVMEAREGGRRAVKTRRVRILWTREDVDVVV